MSGESRASKSGRSLRRGLAEFVIIVVGVLVALAVDAAWESRDEATRAEAYLRLLAADLAATDSALDVARESEARIREDAERLNQALFDSSSVSPETLRSWLGGVGSGTNFNPRTAALDAIIGTGDLRIIESRLHGPLLEYANAVDEVRQLYVPLAGTQVATYFRLGRSFDVLAALRGRAPVEPVQWSELRRDLDVRSTIGELATTARGRTFALRVFSRHLEDLQAAVEGELSGN